MKRLHVHIAVDNIPSSVSFYTNLFGQDPAVLKDDYAKWMVDDPRVNFAISTRGKCPGLDHLGVQVENNQELFEITQRLASANENILNQQGTTCCYAKSDKAWVLDPQGVAWETFKTLGQSDVYSDASQPDIEASSCCVPSK